MISCKEVVKTVSSEDRSSWRKNLRVRFHLMICRHCRKFAQQLEIMKSSFKKLFKSKTAQVSEETIRKLEDDAIRRLKSE